MWPFKRVARGTTTALFPRIGIVTVAVTSSSTSDRAVLNADSSFASTRVPAGMTDADCESARTKYRRNESTDMVVRNIQYVDHVTPGPASWLPCFVRPCGVRRHPDYVQQSGRPHFSAALPDLTPARQHLSVY